MRIAADPAHLVAAHAIRGISLVVAGGAVLDVAPRGVPVERARAGQAPARRMGIQRAGAGGDALVLVAVRAEAGRVAPRARGRIGALLDEMPPEEVLPVDEAAIGPIDQLGLDGDHRSLRMAVEAEILIVARRAGLLRRARHVGVAAQEVPLVRHLRHRLQRVRPEVDVAGRAPRVRVLLRVVVALHAGGVAVGYRRVLTRLGESRVALRAVFLHQLDVRGVIQLQVRFALGPGGGVLDVEVAEVALPLCLLLLVALQALRLLGQEVAGERLRVVDGLVTGDAVDVRLLVAGKCTVDSCISFRQP